MNELITVTQPEMMRKLGWEYPMPSYVSGTAPLLLRWILEANPNAAEAHKALAEMILYDLEERKKPHTIEARVARQNEAYSGLLQMRELAGNVTERFAQYVKDWGNDPEYKAALHAHDHIFDKPGPRST